MSSQIITNSSEEMVQSFIYHGLHLLICLTANFFDDAKKGAEVAAQLAQSRAILESAKNSEETGIPKTNTEARAVLPKGFLQQSNAGQKVDIG